MALTVPPGGVSGQAAVGTAAVMVRVQRLRARVTLDDPGPTLRRAEAAAAAGDESWNRWLEEYRRGEAVIVCVAVAVEVAGLDEAVETANQGVFLEIDSQPPKVEQQVAELVGKDFSALAAELSSRGQPLEAEEFLDMYVHVELAEDVRQALTMSIAAGAKQAGTPDSDAGLSEAKGPS